jgi:hypothetical protein
MNCWRRQLEWPSQKGLAHSCQNQNILPTSSDFDFAFELCRLGAGHRLQFVQQKYAEQLEDEGELEKAEVGNLLEK